MRFAYFDCYSGVSGDMILGALVDAGADLDALRRSLAGLPCGGFRLERRTVMRAGIAAAKVDVVLDDSLPGAGGEDSHDARDHAPAHSHRAWAEIRRTLSQAALSENVRSRALATFQRLAEAEAQVHRIPVENIHFHEVGATDAIVDITGAFLALEALGVEEVWVSPITTGFGVVKTAHGLLPVPAPATALLLAGCPLRRGDTEAELATPTGAAILREAAAGFGAWPDGAVVERIGYGAGTKEFPGQTNFLRVFIGRRVIRGGDDRATGGAPAAASASTPLRSQILTLLQTEIDDMSGEVYSHLFDLLFAAGCYDVTLTPIQMKKNRPGVRIEALCPPDRREAALACLLRETSTFGVKAREIERFCLERRFETVETAYGSVRVKVGLWGEEILKAAPEYEDCRRIAGERGVSFQEVWREASRAAGALIAKPESH